MRDHRKFARLPIEGSLTGDITVALPLEVTQISAGGVLVETDRPLRLESLHELRFALEGTALVIRGRVVHSRVSDWSSSTRPSMCRRRFAPCWRASATTPLRPDQPHEHRALDHAGCLRCEAIGPQLQGINQRGR